MAPSTDAATLVAIGSAGHSGSTLLDLLLGNHPACSSAGEMNRLTLHAPDRMCACGVTVTACPYWNSVRTAITARRGLPALVRWDQCHTDIPPQTPVLRLEGHSTDDFVDGARLADGLRDRLTASGIAVGPDAALSRRGVRDFKWRLVDPAATRGYVLRNGEGCIDVYEADVRWKNPLRLLPDPLEVSLALGVGWRLVCACSSHAARYAEIAANSWSVVDAMAEAAGTRFVIDSSKSPVRLKLLYMLHPDRVRVIHLVRDGRAVAASAMRRREVSAATAARIWRRDNQNLALMFRGIPERHKVHVRYESLCEDPERELRRLCEFLGLEFQPGMLTLWSRPVHNIPGNPMLFDRTARAIRKDERWRRDLTDSDVRAFDAAAGNLNRSLGYV